MSELAHIQADLYIEAPTSFDLCEILRDINCRVWVPTSNMTPVEVINYLYAEVAYLPIVNMFLADVSEGFAVCNGFVH